MPLIFVVRGVLIGLIALGLFGAFNVSFDTFTGIAACPEVIAIPVCFVVLAGYCLILVSVVLTPTVRLKWLFLSAWLPVFLLAITGSILELIYGNTCPKNESGIALCYLSLLLSVTVFILYRLYLSLHFQLSRVKSVN